MFCRIAPANIKCQLGATAKKTKDKATPKVSVDISQRLPYLSAKYPSRKLN